MASIGVGLQFGGLHGAAVGAGFQADQMAYGGIIRIGNEIGSAAAQFNNGWRSGWVLGMR